MWTNVSDLDRMVGAMDLLRSRMNRLFTDFDRSHGGEPRWGWAETEALPPTNLYDAGDHLLVEAEVPGLGKDDLNVKIQGNYLEISGTRKPDAPKGFRTHRVERQGAAFCRSFTLPAEVDADKSEASLKLGLLRLTLPKSEAAKPKRIDIK
jgi:HSP20 family protein